MEKTPSITGIVGEKTSLLASLLAQPEVKESLRLALADIDPDSGSRLVRTFMGADPEVGLTVAGAVPGLVNLVLKALLELVVTIRRSFPAPLLAGFVDSLLKDVNTQDLARLADEIRALAKDLGPALSSFTADLNRARSSRGDRP